MQAMKLLGSGLVLVAVAACSGTRTERPVVTHADGQTTTSPAGTEAAVRGKSLVRLVNAFPSKQDIDVSGDDRTVFTSVAYKAVTTYHEIGDNLVTFRLRGAGTDSVLSDNHETLTDGFHYTIVAQPGQRGQPQMRIMRDEVGPDTGMARLRVINAAPNMGTIDVALQGQKAPLFAGVNYAGGAEYKNVAPGTMTIDIRSDHQSTHPVQLKDRRFEAGRAYTIVLAGWGASGLEAIVFDDTETGGALSLGSRP